MIRIGIGNGKGRRQQQQQQQQQQQFASQNDLSKKKKEEEKNPLIYFSSDLARKDFCGERCLSVREFVWENTRVANLKWRMALLGMTCLK